MGCFLQEDSAFMEVSSNTSLYLKNYPHIIWQFNMRKKERGSAIYIRGNLIIHIAPEFPVIKAELNEK